MSKYDRLLSECGLPGSADIAEDGLFGSTASIIIKRIPKMANGEMTWLLKAFCPAF